MKNKQVSKIIYLQAKNLKGIPKDHIVYIHWKDNYPLVLPKKESGFEWINSVKLSAILEKRYILAA